jgi:hypothetical protein
MAEQSKNPLLLNSLHLPGYSIIFFCAYFYYSLVCCCPARRQDGIKVFHIMFFSVLTVDAIK